MFTHYDRAHVAQLCEKAGLLQRVRYTVDYLLQAEMSLRPIFAWMPICLLCYTARFIWGFSHWVWWECYLSAPIDMLYGKNIGTRHSVRKRHSVRNMALDKVIWCFIWRKYIITMTPIDIKPSPCPAHRRHVSACKISPPYVTPFWRK